MLPALPQKLSFWRGSSVALGFLALGVSWFIVSIARIWDKLAPVIRGAYLRSLLCVFFVPFGLFQAWASWHLNHHFSQLPASVWSHLALLIRRIRSLAPSYWVFHGYLPAMPWKIHGYWAITYSGIMLKPVQLCGANIQVAIACVLSNKPAQLRPDFSLILLFGAALHIWPTPCFLGTTNRSLKPPWLG